MNALPLCRYCGRPIGKSTRHVYLTTKDHNDRADRYHRHIQVTAFPKTKAECQSLTNWTVTHVSRGVYQRGIGMDSTIIGSFYEWDGESYIDRFFCKGECAKSFGYVSASEGRCTKAYNEAVAKRREKAS